MKISLHQPDHVDLDRLVKTCYLVMIASTSEAQCGIENLCERGQSNERRDHAYFGRHVGRS